MKIKLNCDLLNKKKGEVVDLDKIKDLNEAKYWRNRIKDSVIDKCVEILKKGVKKA